MAITGKQRSRRIDRRYTDSVDTSILWKRRLGWAGLALGLAYGLWLLNPSAAKQFSAGELSKAHHAWNQTGCEKCHERLSPIKTTSFGSISAIQSNNDRCNKCHDMPEHYPNKVKRTALAQEACAHCHHEHLGINHNLLDISDENCVRCHKDLSQLAINIPSPIVNISSFDPIITGAHPKFKGLMQDTGTIHFSHIQHMRPGQPAEVDARNAKKFTSLSPRFQPQYSTRVDKDGLVQLDCSDCHVRSNDQGIYQPIDYQKHCQACHQLDVPHKLDMQDMKSLKEDVFASQSRTLKRLLDAVSLNPATEASPTSKQKDEKAIESMLAEKSKQSASGQDLIKLIETGSPSVRTEIYKTYGCAKCHQLESDPAQGPPSTHIVKPSGIKTQWLSDASFTHSAHENIECNKCHNMELKEKVKTSDPQQPTGGLASQVLIGDIDNCRTCHIVNESNRFKAREAGNLRVATGDCIDCHRYHHDPSKVNPGYATGLPLAGRLNEDPPESNQDSVQ